MATTIGFGSLNPRLKRFLLWFIPTWILSLLMGSHGSVGIIIGDLTLLLVWNTSLGCYWGKIKTNEYLYSLNMGPQCICSMCSLDRETIEHLFNQCPKFQAVWSYISNNLGKVICFPNGISKGLWLSSCQANTFVFLKSNVVAGAWFIWKSWCKLILNNKTPDLTMIARRVIAHVWEYSLSLLPKNGNVRF